MINANNIKKIIVEILSQAKTTMEILLSIFGFLLLSNVGMYPGIAQRLL
jgi:hypothetical protein